MMTLLNLVLLIVIVNGISLSEAYREKIEIKIKEKDWTFNGIKNWYYQKGVYDVSAEKPFKIIISDWHGKDVDCRNLHYPEKFMTQFYKENDNTVISIQGVNDAMSTTWKCTLRYNNDTFRDIYFDVNVKDATPPQMVLVNNVVLPTEKVISENYQTGTKKHIATYNFKEGDYLDVTCINPERENCIMTFNYDYVNSLSGMNVNKYSNLRVGFRTIFKAIHNYSRMTCIYSCHEGDPIEVAVTFKLLKELSEGVEMKINGYAVRGTEVKNSANANTNTYIKYAYILENSVKNPNITFTYEINPTNIHFTTICNKCITDKSTNKSFIKQIYFVHSDIKQSKVNYIATITNLANLKKKLEVGFVTLHPKFNVRNPLKLTLPKDKTLIELYEDNTHSLFYYEYNEDVDLPLTCSMPSKRGRRLYFEGKEKGSSSHPHISLNQHISLDQSYHNTTIQCEERNNKGVVALLQVLFLMKVQNATNPVTKVITIPTTASTSSTSSSSTTSTSTTSTSTTTTSTTTTSTTTTSTTISSTTSSSTSTTISTPIATTSTTLRSTITNPNTDGGHEKIIIIVVVIIIIIVFACVGTVLYNKKKRHRDVENEAIVYYKKTSNTAEPAVYDYAVPDVQKRLIVDDDIYAKPVPKSLRQSKNYANHNIPNTYANQDNNHKIDDNYCANDNQAFRSDIYSEVVSKQNIPYIDRNNSNLQNSNMKTDYGNVHIVPKSEDDKITYSNQPISADIYSQVVPKSRRSKTYVNSSVVAHNLDLIDFEPTYSEPTVKK